MAISRMSRKELLERAIADFEKVNGTDPADCDQFFSRHNIGNTSDFPQFPYERFEFLKEFLQRLQASDPGKFAAAHKGTPFYFLAWLAFDMHTFEAAFHFLDASIAEDKRKDPIGWINNPGPQVLMLNAKDQGMHRTVEALHSRIAREFQRFGAHYVGLTFEGFLTRFAQQELRDGTGALVSGFYAYVVEFDDRRFESSLRSVPALGDYQPLFLHLFKGGLLLESILKKKFSNLRTETLGKILQSPDFKAVFGFTPGSISDVSLGVLCGDANAVGPESAFRATGRLRNRMGHSLIAEPLTQHDYVLLAEKEIDAFLWAVNKLYS